MLRKALLTLTRDALPSDAELLRRYAMDRNEAAFSAIVRRHGPAVLGVCRKVLGNFADADDAFQATFLVLARKSRRIAFHADIASWLFAVAVRASRELLRQRARRRAREMNTTYLDVPAPPPSESAEECQVLCDEITKLPEKYRSPVVLCEIGGVSRSKAAKHLGIPEGTLASRLAEARKRLARRLRKRGLAMTVGCLAAPVPSTLAASAIEMATTSAILSPAALQLAEAIMRTNLFSTGKLATIVVLMMTAAGLSFCGQPAKLQVDEAKPLAAGKKAVSESNRLYISRDGRFYSLGPNGENERRILISGTVTGSAVTPSPNGQFLAYWRTPTPKEPQSAIVFTDRNGETFGDSVLLPKNGGYRRFCWSADGTQLHVSQSSGKTPKGGVEHFTVDVKTRAVKRLEMLRGHIVVDWSRDGKYFLTTKVGEAERWEPKSIYLMNTDGTEHKRLATTEGRCAAMGLSPDGTRALCILDDKLTVVSVTNPQNLVLVVGIADGADITASAWSPDGKRIAYTIGTFQDLEKEQLRELESRLVVADPTGKNLKVIRNIRGETFDSVFWR